MHILINKGNVSTAKSYPFWNELISLLKGHEIKEISGILSEQQIKELIDWSFVWISIDTFLPHFAKYHNLKKGIVIWGLSDPLIFGYDTNINLLKDRKYLRPDQFHWWKGVPENKDAFVSPEEVYKAILMV